MALRNVRVYFGRKLACSAIVSTFGSAALAIEPASAVENSAGRAVWVEAAALRDPEISERAIFLAGDPSWSCLEAVSGEERFRLLRGVDGKKDWLVVEAGRPERKIEVIIAASELEARAAPVEATAVVAHLSPEFLS